MKTPYIGYPSSSYSDSVLPLPPPLSLPLFTFFPRQIEYVNLLNDSLFVILDLDLSSLSPQVPEGPSCVIYTKRRQVH